MGRRKGYYHDTVRFNPLLQALPACRIYVYDPITGYVKAYVGGPNYNYFQYDMAMVGRRQVGSTIKPYLYTLAMENGFSPCDEVRNVEQTLFDENGKAWSPETVLNLIMEKW